MVYEGHPTLKRCATTNVQKSQFLQKLNTFFYYFKTLIKLQMTHISFFGKTLLFVVIVVHMLIKIHIFYRLTKFSNTFLKMFSTVVWIVRIN